MRGSGGLATARHPASRNPATTGTQEPVCSLCGQIRIFSSPWKKIKKAARESRPVSPASRGIASWAKHGAVGLQGPRAPGTEAHRSIDMPTVPLSLKEGHGPGTDCSNDSSHADPNTLCCHFGEKKKKKKTQNKFRVVLTAW